MAAYQQIFYWYYDTPAAVEVTSWTYPVEVVESLDVGGALPPDALRMFGAQIEELDIGLALTGLQLISTLRSYTHPPEDQLDIGLAITGIALVNTLRTYNHPPEDFLDVGLALTSLELRPGLVSTSVEPDGLDVGLAITNLALT